VKTTSKKFSTLAIAAALIAATMITGTTTANAVVAKANAACPTAGTKTTISKVAYTCAVSPIATNKKLTWVSATCLSANTAYGKAVQQQKTLVDAEAYAEAKLQKVIDSFTQTRDLWLKAQAEYQKRIDSAIAANPKANTTTDTTGMTNAKTRAASADKKVISWQGILADTKKTQSTLLAQGADNLLQAKKDVGTICKSGY
jgi:response regulator of citrate/malate metabolism